jgi:hypothetical protein
VEKINLNRYVVFALGEKGIEIFNKRNDKLIKVLGKNTSLENKTYQELADKDGCYSMQFWAFMDLFGKHITIPGVIIDFNIFLPKEDVIENK